MSGVYALKPTLPAVGGNEGVGEVTEVGSEVHGLSAGDHVVLRAEQCLGIGGTFPLFRHVFKGARSCYLRQFCLILSIVSSKCQIGRARVFHLQNQGHITTENDFPAV